jgi:hypothetical protein
MVNHILIPLQLDLVEHGFVHLRHYLLEDNGSELYETLITQIGNRLHIDVESVQVLEKSLHPPNHHFVVHPPFVQLVKQLISI